MAITVGNECAFCGVRKIVRKTRGLAVGDMGESGGCARRLVRGLFFVRSRVIASVFVKLLHFVFGVETVLSGEFEINLMNGVVVAPSTDFLHFQFAKPKMETEGGKGATETVNTALRKVILFADQVDAAAQRIFSTIQNGKAGAFPLRKQLVKGGDHNLDRALRRNVFVGLFIHKVSVFIHDPCALNFDPLFL